MFLVRESVHPSPRLGALGLLVLLATICCLSCVTYYYDRFQESMPEQRSGDFAVFEDKELTVGFAMTPQVAEEHSADTLWWFTVYWQPVVQDSSMQPGNLETIRVLRITLYDDNSQKVLVDNLAPSESRVDGVRIVVAESSLKDIRIGDDVDRVRCEVDFQVMDTVLGNKVYHLEALLDRKRGSFKSPPGWWMH